MLINMRARYILLLAFFCIPLRAPAQTAAQTGPRPDTRKLAQQLLQQCENTDELGRFDPVSCFAQHVDDGYQAVKRRNWTEAIREESDAIAVLVTYPQRLRSELASGEGVTTDGHVVAAIDSLTSPYLIRATAYEENKQYDLAISDATAAITLDPTESVLWNARCWNRAILGDLPDAVQDCNRALQLAPEDPNILDSAGFVYLRLKNYPAAISRYRAALKIDPKIASSRYGLGLAEQALNDQVQGKQDIVAAEQIDPKITSDFGT